jgi:hypothetical protein
MERPKLAAVAVALVVVPVLAFFGCNKKEDLAPAPSATQAPVPAPPPPAVTPPPPPAAPVTTPQHAAMKVTTLEAGTRDAAVVMAVPDAARVAIPALPQLPSIAPSSLPSIASGIVGGIVGALPSGLIPPPPAPNR